MIFQGGVKLDGGVSGGGGVADILSADYLKSIMQSVNSASASSRYPLQKVGLN